MKVEILVKKEVELKTLKVRAGARYWEDATVNGVEDTEGNLIPFRNGDYWEPEIDLDLGTVINWPVGTTAEIHYKVCDDGTYYLKDYQGNIVLKKRDYVPDIMCPEGDGFGDYIIMNIDENGVIDNWPEEPSFDEFNAQ